MPVTIERKNKKTGEVNVKQYETVAERLRKFRDSCPVQGGWGLVTEIQLPDSETVVAKAIITSPDGKNVATGTAEENRKAGYINETSAVENAETSAIGRALFAAGFGGGEFCSADELYTALKQQENIKAAELKLVNGGKPPESETDTNKNLPGPKIDGITYRRKGNLIIADGNTFQSKGLLKSAGFKWDSGEKGWVKEAAKGGKK